MHEVEEEEKKNMTYRIKPLGGGSVCVQLCVALRWHVYAFITKQPLIGITSKFPSIDSARIALERSVMFNSVRVSVSCSAGRVLYIHTYIYICIHF